MKNLQARARIARRAAQAACLGILLSSVTFAEARGGFQHGGSHPAPAPHSQPQSHPQGHPQSGGHTAQPPHAPQQGGYPHYPSQSASHYQQQPIQPGRPPAGYGQPGAPRPAYNGTPYSMRATPQQGHLPQWMAQHQNLPVNQQERLLRSEPGFNRLNPTEQQRAVQQLHQMNQMPEPQRERRLARAENIERLSPADRMRVNQSAQQLRGLAPDRQTMVRRAFRDLRGVPVDQRDTMINSARYGSAFSPEERGILSNLLRVEPYEAPR